MIQKLGWMLFHGAKCIFYFWFIIKIILHFEFSKVLTLILSSRFLFSFHVHFVITSSRLTLKIVHNQISLTTSSNWLVVVFWAKKDAVCSRSVVQNAAWTYELEGTGIKHEIRKKFAPLISGTRRNIPKTDSRNLVFK